VALELMSMCVCVAVYNSLTAELEDEKEMREAADTKQKELQATEAQQQQKIHDLESQICDLEAAKVSSVCAIFCITVYTVAPKNGTVFCTP